MLKQKIAKQQTAQGEVADPIGVSPKDMKVLRKAFNKFDKDGNGTMDAAELSEVRTNTYASELLPRTSAEPRVGTVSLTPHLISSQLAAELAEPLTEEEIAEGMKEMDKGGTGHIPQHDSANLTVVSVPGGGSSDKCLYDRRLF